jgi:hypothetical protein
MVAPSWHGLFASNHSIQSPARAGLATLNFPRRFALAKIVTSGRTLLAKIFREDTCFPRARLAPVRAQP